MKKLFSMLLILSLILAAVPALADLPVDLTALSLEELQQLAAAADAEIISRTTESFEVPTGVYIIGEDFPAGTYRVEVIKSSGILGLYKSKRDYDDDEPFYYEFVGSDEPVGKINLEKGVIFSVDSGMRLSLYKGLGW